MTSLLRAVLTELVDQGGLASFDLFFTETLARLDPRAEPAALLAGAFARRAIDQGHVCVTLAEIEQFLAPGTHSGEKAVTQADLQRILSASILVGDGSQPTPLVLEGDRLYLYRYWRYETRLAKAILGRAPAKEAEADEATEALLDRLLADSAMRPSPGQRQAMLMAVNRELTVVSGGPGTGKTTIVVYMLALLLESAATAGRPLPKILLLAPTGKAAARLAQAVHEKLDLLPVTERIRAAFPREALTIHRALGFQRQTPTTFRHNAANLLAAEVVVTDEASMVDMALMAKLFDAVRPEARLILLGDKDQLASVEAGSLMGDICLAAGIDDAAPANRRLGRSVLQLAESFRFTQAQGIGAMVRQIKAGNGESLVALLDGRHEDAVLYEIERALTENKPLRSLVIEGFRPCLQAATPAAALERLQDFRVLCAHRHGPTGVRVLNDFCVRVLAEAGLLQPEGLWFKGRPLMVTANSYRLDLFNGDLGIVWPAPEDGTLRAYFPDAASGRPRAFLPGKLPSHETAFAMTVHKSQGSEFERLAVVLPREPSPVLTRELLYTAVSRAKKAVALFGAASLVHEAVARRVARRSGLRERLAMGDSGAATEAGGEP